MTTTELAPSLRQPLQHKFFTRRLGDLIGHDNPALDYVRPSCWRDTLKCDVAKRRWKDWTAQLEPGDSVFHKMPDDLEDAWCAILDWLRWDYLRMVHRSTAPEPRMGAFHRLPRVERDRAIEAAHAMWMHWGTMRGRPWAIVRDARVKAFTCHQIDFYRRRAGEQVIYTAPPLRARERFSDASAKPFRPSLHTLRRGPIRRRPA